MGVNHNSAFKYEENLYGLTLIGIGFLSDKVKEESITINEYEKPVSCNFVLF